MPWTTLENHSSSFDKVARIHANTLRINKKLCNAFYSIQMRWDNAFQRNNTILPFAFYSSAVVTSASLAPIFGCLDKPYWQLTFIVAFKSQRIRVHI